MPRHPPRKWVWSAPMALLAFVLLRGARPRRALPGDGRRPQAGARAQGHAEPARPQGDDVLFVLRPVFGVAIPRAVFAADKDRDAIPEANVTQLTALQKHGRELFGQRCRTCHTLGRQRDATSARTSTAAPAEGARARRDREGPRARQRPDGRGPRRGRGRRGRRPVRRRRDRRVPRGDEGDEYNRPGESDSAAETAPRARSPRSLRAFPPRPASVPPERPQPCCAGRREAVATEGDRYGTTCLQGNSPLLQCPAASAESPSDTGAGDPVVGANRHRVALLSSASPSANPASKGRGRPPSCQSTPTASSALYDQQNENRIADWGGDELFTRMPRPRAVDDAPAPRFRPSLVLVDPPDRRRAPSPAPARDRPAGAARAPAEAGTPRRRGRGDVRPVATARSRPTDPALGRRCARRHPRRSGRRTAAARAVITGRPDAATAAALARPRRAPPPAPHARRVDRPAPRADHGLGVRARPAADPHRDLDRRRRVRSAARPERRPRGRHAPISAPARTRLARA